jgi:integrase
MGRNRISGISFDKKTETYIIDKIIGGKRLYKRIKTSSREEVEAIVVKYQEEARKAEIFGTRPTRTFEQAAAKYLRENITKRSIANDGLHLQQLMPYIGNLALSQVNISALQSFISARKREGKKTKTINNALGVVRHLLNQAASEWFDEHGLTWLDHAPKIKLLPVKDAKPPHPLTFSEQRNLFFYLPDYLHDMCLFKVNTGTRNREVCNLRWEWERQIPELKTSVFIIPEKHVKNQLPRVVVLNRVAASIIQKMRGQNKIFVFARDDRPYYSINGRAWKAARKAVDLDVRVHDLKHTFGYRLRMAGVNEYHIQELLGHKSKTISQHYSASEIEGLLKSAEMVCDLDTTKGDLSVLHLKKFG